MNIPLPPSPIYSPSQVTSSHSEDESLDVVPAAPANIIPLPQDQVSRSNSNSPRSTQKWEKNTLLGKEKAKQRLKAFKASKSISFGLPNMNKCRLKTPSTFAQEEEDEISPKVKTTKKEKDSSKSSKKLDSAPISTSQKESDIQKEKKKDEEDKSIKPVPPPPLPKASSTKVDSVGFIVSVREPEEVKKKPALEKRREKSPRKGKGYAEKFGFKAYPTSWQEFKDRLIFATSPDIKYLMKDLDLKFSKTCVKLSVPRNEVVYVKTADPSRDPFSDFSHEIEIPKRSLKRTHTRPKLEWSENRKFCRHHFKDRKEILSETTTELKEQILEIVKSNNKMGTSNQKVNLSKEDLTRDWFVLASDFLAPNVEAARFKNQIEYIEKNSKKKLKKKKRKLEDLTDEFMESLAVEMSPIKKMKKNKKKKKKTVKPQDEGGNELSDSDEETKKRSKDKISKKTNKKKKKKHNDDGSEQQNVSLPVTSDSDKKIFDIERKSEELAVKKKPKKEIVKKSPNVSPQNFFEDVETRSRKSRSGPRTPSPCPEIRSHIQGPRTPSPSKEVSRHEKAEKEAMKMFSPLSDTQSFSNKVPPRHISEPMARDYSRPHSPPLERVRRSSPSPRFHSPSHQPRYRLHSPDRHSRRYSPGAYSPPRKQRNYSPVERYRRSPPRSPVGAHYSPRRRPMSPPRSGYSNRSPPRRYMRSPPLAREDRYRSFSPCRRDQRYYHSERDYDFDRSMPDSTISDMDLLASHRSIPYPPPRDLIAATNAAAGFGPNSVAPAAADLLSPKRLSLDERLEKELGIKVMTDYSRPPPGYLPSGHMVPHPIPHPVSVGPSISQVHNPPPPIKPLTPASAEQTMPVFPGSQLQTDIPEEGRLVRVGNMLQIVPEVTKKINSAQIPPPTPATPPTTAIKPSPGVGETKEAQALRQRMEEMRKTSQRHDLERKQKREERLAARIQKQVEKVTNKDVDDGTAVVSGRILESLEKQEEINKEAKILQEAMASVPEDESDKEAAKPEPNPQELALAELKKRKKDKMGVHYISLKPLSKKERKRQQRLMASEAIVDCDEDEAIGEIKDGIVDEEEEFQPRSPVPLPDPSNCKPILVQLGFSLTQKSKKVLRYADGVLPGQGSPDNEGEDSDNDLQIKSEPKEKKVRRRKKIMLQIIRSRRVTDSSSDDEESGPPPAPPPGSPPIWHTNEFIEKFAYKGNISVSN